MNFAGKTAIWQIQMLPKRQNARLPFWRFGKRAFLANP